MTAFVISVLASAVALGLLLGVAAGLHLVTVGAKQQNDEAHSSGVRILALTLVVAWIAVPGLISMAVSA